MTDFFSNQPTGLPSLNLLVHASLVLSLPALLWLTVRYRDHQAYPTVFRALQLIQLVAIYGWYALAQGFPLAESLPLYHCRIAMFVVLLGKPSKVKDYFAMLGLGGSLAALLFPDFDPYPLFHVTIFSLIFGHIALWVNSTAYLLSSDRRQTLSVREIVLTTLVLDAVLVLVNQLTGGNYGFLARTPLLQTTNLLFNYGLVSLVIIALIVLVQKVYHTYYQPA